MKQILVYGDSLSWGIIPSTRKRFSFSQRWPGVMELELIKSSLQVRVIEDCLNGRRTVLEDPMKPGRNGLLGFEQTIESHSPLSLILIMLGTNDFQAMHDYNIHQSAEGLKALVNAARNAPVEPGMTIPPILLISPPQIQQAQGDIASKFEGAEEKSVGLPKAIRSIAKASNCQFFDANTVTRTSQIDGVHLDKEQHQSLGMALADTIKNSDAISTK